LFQPFVAAGIGFAYDAVGEWTRTKNWFNPKFANDPVRAFEGDSPTDVALSIGLGALLQLTLAPRWPVIMEAIARHYDLGTASGSAIPSRCTGGRPGTSRALPAQSECTWA
jgi:hypothetical protein